MSFTDFFIFYSLINSLIDISESHEWSSVRTVRAKHFSFTLVFCDEVKVVIYQADETISVVLEHIFIPDRLNGLVDGDRLTGPPLYTCCFVGFK